MTATTLAAPPPPRNHRRAPCSGTDARETERLLLVRYHEYGRPRRARGAGGAFPAAGARSRTALHVHRRALRRPASGGEPRPDQGDRPLRARPRDEVHELRRADDPRRAEAPLPRQGMVAPRAARPPGAHARSEPRDGDPLQGARPLARRCARWRGTSAARAEQVLEAQEASAELRGGVARRAGRARRRRVRIARGDARGRGLGLRAGRGPRTRSRAPGWRFPRWSGRCSSCASCTT